MPAVAFSNNDIAVVAWTFDRHLDGCLGFAIHQIDIDANNKETVLPALARFATQDKSLKLTTEQAPIQKFWWKDLFAKRGSTYQYRIVPMGGTPGQALAPLKDAPALLSNKVTLTPSRPDWHSRAHSQAITAPATAVTIDSHGQPNHALATATGARTSAESVRSPKVPQECWETGEARSAVVAVSNSVIAWDTLPSARSDRPLITRASVSCGSA